MGAGGRWFKSNRPDHILRVRPHKYVGEPYPDHCEPAIALVIEIIKAGSGEGNERPLLGPFRTGPRALIDLPANW